MVDIKKELGGAAKEAAARAGKEAEKAIRKPGTEVKGKAREVAEKAGKEAGKVERKLD